MPQDRVNIDENSKFSFGAKYFTDLLDVFDSYVGIAKYKLVVNDDGTGIVAVPDSSGGAQTFLGLDDVTPTEYAGQDKKVVTVDEASNSLVFSDATGGIGLWTPESLSPILTIDTADLAFVGAPTATIVVTADTSVVTPISVGNEGIYVASSERYALVENDLKATYFSIILPTAQTLGDVLYVYLYDDLIQPTTGIPLAGLRYDGAGGYQFWNSFNDTPIGSVFTAAQIESSEWASTFNMNDGLSADFSIYKDGVLDATFNFDTSPFPPLVGVAFHLFIYISGGNTGVTDGAQFTQLRAPVNEISLSTQLTGSPIVDPLSYPTVTETTAFITTGMTEPMLSTSGYIDNAYIVGFSASGDLVGITSVNAMIKGDAQVIEAAWLFDIAKSGSLIFSGDNLIGSFHDSEYDTGFFLESFEDVSANSSKAHLDLQSDKRNGGSSASLGNNNFRLKVRNNGEGTEEYVECSKPTDQMVGGFSDNYIVTKGYFEDNIPTPLNDLVRRDVAAGSLTCFVNWQYLIYGTSGSQNLTINLPPVLEGKKGDRIVLYVSATNTTNFVRLVIDAFGTTNIFDGYSSYETPLIATADAIGYTVVLDHSGDVNLGWIPNFNVMYKA